jgi:hypothetical protein
MGTSDHDEILLGDNAPFILLCVLGCYGTTGTGSGHVFHHAVNSTEYQWIFLFSLVCKEELVPCTTKKDAHSKTTIPTPGNTFYFVGPSGIVTLRNKQCWR